MTWKRLRKIIWQLLLIFCVLKKKKYTLLILQNVTLPIKNKNSINDSKWRKRKITSCSKKIAALLHGRTSKQKSDFYCLNCLHSLRTENKLKSHKEECKNEDCYGIIMPSGKNKILENLINIWSQIKCHTLFMLTLNLQLKK